MTVLGPLSIGCAIDAARAAALTEPDDGGSCNFDTVRVSHRKSSVVEADLTRAGLRFYHDRGAYHLSPPEAGQGLRRSVQVEAMAKELQRHELEATVEYVTD